MRRHALPALLAVIAFTAVFGLAYPLAMTGVSQLLFPGKADGSRLTVDGRLVGSALIGQEFKSRAYFHSRPSQTEYSPSTTYFSNAGPDSVEARESTRENLAAYVALEKPYDRWLTRRGVPVDAITTSASGVDPEISQANARIQAHRVAAVRKLPLAEVEDLIAAHTSGRALGVFGEPGVNVLKLNIALDETTAKGLKPAYMAGLRPVGRGGGR